MRGSRRLPELLLVVAAAIVLAAPGACARELRIGAGGSIADAVRRARPGDVVQLAPGIYPGGIWIDASGAPGRPIVVRGAAPLGASVIEGGDEALQVGDGAHDLVFERLEVRRSGDNLVHIQGRAHDIVLRDLRVHDAGPDGDGIKVNQAANITIERVECFHPGPRPDRPDGNPAQECIDLLDVAHAVVRDCDLHDGGNMLLYAKGASTDVLFERNVLHGQGGDAIDPCLGIGAVTDTDLLAGRGYEAERVVVRNNVVANCGAGAIGVYDAHDAWIVHNTLIDDGAEVIQFRAGNGARAESRDLHVINNLVVDRGGAIARVIALRSHAVHGLDVQHNAYWNGGRSIPSDGLDDPNREAGATRADPRLAMDARASDRAGWIRSATPHGALGTAATLPAAIAPPDDLAGHTRPATNASIGAIEPDALSARAAPPPTGSLAPGR